MRRRFVVLVVLGMMANVAGAQQPIVAIDVTPNKNVFQAADWDKPLVLKSADDAAKYFGKDALETIRKKVDFEKQFLLVFAWEGSGRDTLEFTVAESFPEQIFFTRTSGITFDLQPHTRVYALRSNVRWSVKLKR